MPLFFMTVSWKASDKDRQVHPHVYGPFDNRDEMNTEIQRRYPNDKHAEFIVFEGFLDKVIPSPKEKPEDEKRAPGDMKNYAGNPEDGYVCRECDGPILGARVAHPIHTKLMPGAGSGECRYETVPYCPNCDKTPNFNGAPVYLEDL
jgi:hypothetical protein